MRPFFIAGGLGLELRAYPGFFLQQRRFVDAQLIGKFIYSLIIRGLLGFEAGQLFAEIGFTGADALHQFFMMRLAGRGQQAFQLLHIVSGLGQRGFAQCALLRQAGFFPGQRPPLYFQAVFKLALKTFAAGGQRGLQLLFFQGVFPLQRRRALARGRFYRGQPAAVFRLKAGALLFPARVLRFQPGQQLLHAGLFGIFFLFKLQQLGAESRFFFRYQLKQLAMVRFLLRG